MNYYNRHIGDYTKDTAYLTFAQDGAYNRMLDLYYSKEQPLPLDRDELYRKLRAKTKADRAAVDAVLVDFFIESPEGWRKNRCDEEIAKAREEGEDSAAKRENEKERQRRHRERRKEIFKALRGYGVVPKYDTPTEQLETLLSRELQRTCHGDGHAPVTPLATAVPIANSQEPIASTPQSQKQGPNGEDLAPDGAPVDFIFKVGKALLKAADVQGDHGSILGKVRKSLGDKETAALLARMAATTPPISQPVEYLMAACRPKEKRNVV